MELSLFLAVHHAKQDLHVVYGCWYWESSPSLQQLFSQYQTVFWVAMNEKHLSDVFKKHGGERFDPINEEFDPQI